MLINREPLPHLTPDVELLGNCDDVINQLCQLLGEGWEEPVHAEQLRQAEQLAFPSAPSAAPADDLARKEGEAAPVAAVATKAAEASSPVQNVAGEEPSSAGAPAEAEGEDSSSSSLPSLAGLWQPKRKISWSARLVPGTFLFKPPNRYVFPGAEVFSESEDEEESNSSSSSSSSSSNGSVKGDAVPVDPPEENETEEGGLPHQEELLRQVDNPESPGGFCWEQE